MASRKNNPKSDAASWVLIAVLFLVGLWPLALAVLLFNAFWQRWAEAADAAAS